MNNLKTKKEEVGKNSAKNSDFTIFKRVDSDEKDVSFMYDQINKIRAENGYKLPKSERVFNALMDQEGLELFKDAIDDSAWVKFKKGTVIQVVPVSNRFFRSYVREIAYDRLGLQLSKDTVEEIIEQIESRAICTGKQYNLKIRVAKVKTGFFYDLGNDVVIIAENTWGVLPQTPILFKRHSHAKEQVTPIKGGSFEKFFDFVNIKSPKDKILLTTAIISGFIENIAHPIVAINGVKGSAKSSLAKKIVRLLDPSKIEDITMGRIDQLCQTADHRWVLSFDNLSYIKNEQSDFLCKLVTGTGFSTRKLYTDDEDIIRQLRRFIVINGVSLVVKRPDLLDRCIIINLEKISDEERKTDEEVNKAFEEALPFILGSCFDILSRAIKIYPSLNITKLPRLADFALWGCAISIAMGHTAEDFLSAYAQNVEEQNSEAINSSPLAMVLLKYLKNQNKLEGTPTEVFNTLKTCHFSILNETDKEQIPKNVISFSKRLREIKPNLEAYGYIVEESKGVERHIVIYSKAQQATVLPVELPNMQEGRH